MDEGPDYRQQQECEEHQQHDERRLSELQAQAKQERDDEFRQALEARFPMLRAWPGKSEK
jgi:hypothetical protein